MKTTTVYKSPKLDEATAGLSDEMPVFKVGDWVVMTEDGFWASVEYVFKTKSDAIQDVSNATMDARKTPRVSRYAAGVYEYMPKNCDDGSYGRTFIVRRITEKNVEQYNRDMKEQWEGDSFDEDDD